MNRLSQYVNESLWRLQLLEPDIHNANKGTIDGTLYTWINQPEDTSILIDILINVY